MQAVGLTNTGLNFRVQSSMTTFSDFIQKKVIVAALSSSKTLRDIVDATAGTPCLLIQNGGLVKTKGFEGRNTSGTRLMQFVFLMKKKLMSSSFWILMQQL